MKSQNNYFPQLDGLRFLAVGAVLFCHWAQDIPSLHGSAIYLGDVGVNLFFVLSGFLITGILLQSKRKNLKTGQTLVVFYIRRTLRIFPLYYGVLFLCYIVKMPNERIFNLHLLTYTFNYATAMSDQDAGYMRHLWSLSVEEQFYIFFPLIVLFLKEKQLKNFFCFLIIGSIVSRGIIYISFPDKSKAWVASVMFTPACLDCFGLGALLAFHTKNRNASLKILLKKKWMFITSAFISMILFYMVLRSGFNIYTTLFYRFAMAVFFFWLIGKAGASPFSGLPGRILTYKPIIYLGRISYGIYVFHYFMPIIASHFHIPGGRLLYLPITVAIAAVSYHLYELPINNIKKHFPYQTLRPFTSP